MVGNGLASPFFFSRSIFSRGDVSGEQGVGGEGVNARSRPRDERTRESGGSGRAEKPAESRSTAMGVPDLHSLVERTIGPMGYELVDVEFGPRGLLRVFIDAEAGIQIEDCEAVSRQLSHVFTVEDIDYGRLEVSSPGLDRPLKQARDFVRFSGSRITIRLRAPFQGRRNFEGLLSVEETGRFGLELVDPEPAVPRTPGAARAAAKSAARSRRVPPKAGPEAAESTSVRKLIFSLDEVERARLVPVVKF